MLERRKCASPGCERTFFPRSVTHKFCPEHSRTKKADAGRRARYGWGHQVARARWAPAVATGKSRALVAGCRSVRLRLGTWAMWMGRDRVSIRGRSMRVVTVRPPAGTAMARRSGRISRGRLSTGSFGAGCAAGTSSPVIRGRAARRALSTRCVCVTRIRLGLRMGRGCGAWICEPATSACDEVVRPA